MELLPSCPRHPGTMPLAIVHRIIKLLRSVRKRPSALVYWQERARKHGVRSVLNIGHSAAEVAAHTRFQKDHLFPILRDQLTGEEETVLDFGCGPGRFTPDLAKIVHGTAIGVDPISHLLDLAAPVDNVEYRLMTEGDIPVPDRSIDVAWICLVLGGIVDEEILASTVAELDRVLKDDGLLFLVEDTADIPDRDYWKYRSEDSYRELVRFVDLKPLSSYQDLNNRVSVMAGRRHG